jgi:DNA repair exonuclease SbcCD ATPase subunit
MNDSASLASKTASVAAALDKAEAIAKELSLAAKNARFVVFRAGSQAAGLTVITSYFAELAENTIQLVHSINDRAMRIANDSVKEWKSALLIGHLKDAQDMLEDRRHIETVKQHKHRINQQQHQLSSVLQKELDILDGQLEEIQSLMRAASVIVVTSRLESNRTGDFEQNLREMADNIQRLTNQIKEHATESRRILSETD